MKLNQVYVFSVIMLAAAALAGCKHKGDMPTEAPPVKVSAMVIGDSVYSRSQEYSGTVSSANTTTVSFAVAGTIDELYVGEGQRVGQGQLLGKLKAGDYANANNIAKAELAEAQDAYERLKKLHEANALPDIKWVEVQQKLKQAQNAADISERALNETMLRSPMTGVVSRKIADRGQNVAPIEPVYEIISTDDLTIDISVPETEVGSFKEGQSASIEFQGMDPVLGKITRKSIVADPLTRTYKINVAVPSASGRVLPGMVGTVRFSSSEPAEMSETHESIMLPSQAVVLNNDNRTFVWVVKGGVAQRKFVVADELVATGVIVNGGLALGDTVIVEGMQKVGTGSRVEVTLKN